MERYADIDFESVMIGNQCKDKVLVRHSDIDHKKLSKIEKESVGNRL